MRSRPARWAASRAAREAIDNQTSAAGRGYTVGLRQLWREHNVLEPLRVLLNRGGVTEGQLGDAAVLYQDFPREFSPCQSSLG